jgi:hypothetical protein
MQVMLHPVLSLVLVNVVRLVVTAGVLAFLAALVRRR